MRLTKLFNLKYLLQNLKKSRGALAVFLGLIPILNFLIFLVTTISSRETQILNLQEISGVNIVGAFIIPIIMSYCLFGYLFKKKSVDFVGSMPVDRKTIFISNTIGGVALIVIMNILNVILLSIVANIFNGFIFTFSMALDYFVLWTISYIFIFTVTNLAVVLSGNFISALVVACLMFFLVPFTVDYINIKSEQGYTNIYNVKCLEESCQPIEYFCSDKECTEYLKQNIYRTHMEEVKNAPNHVAPYSYISNAILYNYSDYNTSFYNTIAIIKMFVLSIIAIILGLIAFTKRKMEICETSFASMIVHNIVKSLVLVPVYCVMLEILFDEGVTIIIFLALIIIYYLVYDLITMRKLNLQKKSIFTFLLMSALIVWGLISINYFASREEKKIININDIESVAVTFDNDYILEEIYVADKDLINYIMKIELTSYEYSNTSEEELNYIIDYSFKVDGKEYKSSSWVNKEAFDYIVESLNKNPKFMQEIRTISDNIQALAFEDIIYEDDAEILSLIIRDLRTVSFEKFIAAYKGHDLPVTIRLISYENHDIKYKLIPAGLSKELEDTVAKAQNKALQDALSRRKETRFTQDAISIYLYNTEYFTEFGDMDRTNTIVSFLLDYSYSEIISHINKHINDKIDLSKDYIYFDVYYNGNNYRYITNDIKGIKDIILNKHKQLINTEEYSILLKSLESDEKLYD